MDENEYLFQSRLRKLEAEYDEWAQCPPSNVSTFDILPHVADVASFRPFDAIIKIPEEIKADDKIFTSALMELPTWIQEWRDQVDAEIAALCAVSKCHLALISTDATDGPSIDPSESLKLSSEVYRYNLASILFRASTPFRVLCNYTELLLLPIFQSSKPPTYPSMSRARSSYPWSTSPGSEYGKPVVRFCREAAHVVRACGLDPAVATADDMESRNARLVCLMCANNAPRFVRPWTNAVRARVFVRNEGSCPCHRYAMQRSFIEMYRIIRACHGGASSVMTISISSSQSSARADWNLREKITFVVYCVDRASETYGHVKRRCNTL